MITTDMCQEVPELITSAQVSAMIFDIRINDCDSLELLKDIKEIYPDFPVVLYTAYDSYREDDKSVAPEHYVVKSFNLAELKEKRAQVIRQVKEDEISWPKHRRAGVSDSHRRNEGSPSRSRAFSSYETTTYSTAPVTSPLGSGCISLLFIQHVERVKYL